MQIDKNVFVRSQVAAHEVGHALVFAALTGWPSSLFVRSKPTENGCVEYASGAATKRQFAIAATAGFVAELMLIGRLLNKRVTVESCLAEWKFFAPLASPSDTDLIMISKNWRTRKKHLAEAYKILQRHRDCLFYTAGVLMQRRQISASMTAKIFNAFAIDTKPAKTAKLDWGRVVEIEISRAMKILVDGIEKGLEEQKAAHTETRLVASH